MGSKRTWIIVLAGILAVAAIWLAAAQPWASDVGTAGAASRLALDISGRTLDDATFDSGSYAGRPAVVNFFASWCPSCRDEAAGLAAFARAHPEVTFVGVDIQDKLADARDFVARYDVRYPVVRDDDGEIAWRYGVDGLPTTMFFDREGRQVEVVVGPMDRAGFEEKLKAAL